MNEQGRQQIYEGLRRLSIPYCESMSNFILAELGEQAEILYHKSLERGSSSATPKVGDCLSIFGFR